MERARAAIPRNNSLGVVSGLLLVALVLAMIGSFQRVAAIMHGPIMESAYELTASSRHVDLTPSSRPAR